MAEIRREGPWALRALGYSFGVADRATPQLQWVQAVHGDALVWMRVGEAGIIASAALPMPTRARDPGGGYHVAAGGKCLIEAGPPAADLATCAARVGGYAHLSLSGVAGLHFAGGICAMIVSRGLGVVCTYASGTEEIVPERFHRSGWILALPTDEGPAFHAGSARTEHVDLAKLTTQVLLAPGEAQAGAIEEDLAALLEHREGQPGMFAISVFAGAQKQRAKEPNPNIDANDWPKRVADAHAHGVTVTREDLRNLYALEERTWAPSSERSRRQAAF